MVPTYLSKDLLKNKQYLFISYSHNDQESTVYPILKDAFDSDVNFWYDKELNVGDNWFDEVSDVIQSRRCVGAVIFLSRHSVGKLTIFREIKELNLRRSKTANFKTMVVLVGYNTIKEYTSDVASKIDDMNNMLQFLGELNTLIEGNDRLYYVHEKDEDTVEEIVSFSKRMGANAKGQVLAGSFLDWEKNEKRGNEYFLKLGICEWTNEVISWKLINYDKNTGQALYVSEFCVDFIGRNRIGDFEAMLHKQLSFDYVCDSGIIKESYITDMGELVGDFIPTDKSDEHRSQVLRLFLVDGNIRLKLYNSQNVLISENILPDVNYGVRLYLIIDSNKIDIIK